MFVYIYILHFCSGAHSMETLIMCKYVYCIVILVYGDPLLSYCANLKNMCVYVHVYYTFIVVLLVIMGALIMCMYIIL